MDAVDISRRLGDLIRWARVVSVDRDAARCTVDAGTGEAGPLPWLAGRAGAVRIWSPPTEGEQVMVLCPHGDIAAGVVLLGVFSDAMPAPSSDDLVLMQFDDGCALSYDQTAKELRADLPGGGKVFIVADGGVEIDGPLHVTGKITADDDLSVAGDIAVDRDVVAEGDVKAGSISLTDHTHSGVQSGTSSTGAAQ